MCAGLFKVYISIKRYFRFCGPWVCDMLALVFLKSMATHDLLNIYLQLVGHPSRVASVWVLDHKSLEYYRQINIGYNRHKKVWYNQHILSGYNRLLFKKREKNLRCRSAWLTGKLLLSQNAKCKTQNATATKTKYPKNANITKMQMSQKCKHYQKKSNRHNNTNITKTEM